MKKKITILLSVLILTYILVFIKIINTNKVICKLTTKQDLYEKKETIKIDNNKLTIKNEYISKNDKILDLKKEEYIAEKYKVIDSKNKIKAIKEINITDSKKEIEILTKEGYTCK